MVWTQAPTTWGSPFAFVCLVARCVGCPYANKTTKWLPDVAL
ncbi:hypothetical protein PR003_g30145 [Phytophthora rubi]|uniref:Uncharacterized protein n=2 Tax=Phytophthora TaxID=4783 RepID=A0A6A4BHT5_9STRA|nr:hypothetical protein PF008_g30475 [Phytophthora fragariae]KAE9272633.1 hypothetical protein PR003_g30145 [Phytophthora rubi]